MAAGLFWLIVTAYDTPYDMVDYAMPAMMFVFGFIFALMFAFRYARLNGLQWDDYDSDDEPPAHGMLEFEDTARTAGPRLVARDPQMPKRIIIAGQYISMRNWRRLASTLAHHNWHFTRDVLQEAGTFTSLSKNWPKIQADFIRLGWVIGNDVTEAGRVAIKSENPPTLDRMY